MKFISSEASIKILSTLAGDPMRVFYQREVSMEARVSVGSANCILRLLAERELVVKERRRKVFLYKYNLENPLARQIKILFNINDLSDLVLKLRASCKRIVLFGSCAEGTDVKDSEIDLFTLTDQKSEVRRAAKGYERSLGRKLSPIILNAGDFRH